MPGQLHARNQAFFSPPSKAFKLFQDKLTIKHQIICSLLPAEHNSNSTDCHFISKSLTSNHVNITLLGKKINFSILFIGNKWELSKARKLCLSESKILFYTCNAKGGFYGKGLRVSLMEAFRLLRGGQSQEIVFLSLASGSPAYNSKAKQTGVLGLGPRLFQQHSTFLKQIVTWFLLCARYCFRHPCSSFWLSDDRNTVP